jgi:hypothetical protein
MDIKPVAEERLAVNVICTRAARTRAASVDMAAMSMVAMAAATGMAGTAMAVRAMAVVAVTAAPTPTPGPPQGCGPRLLHSKNVFLSKICHVLQAVHRSGCCGLLCVIDILGGGSCAIFIQRKCLRNEQTSKYE